MPTIIDSLFLELGIDVSKFSTDQRNALKKLAEFESQAKRSAGRSADAISKVSEAFRDLGKVAGGVSGGASSPFGTMAKGLGMLLSPAALGTAAVAALGAEVFDFNKQMTDANATLARNAELTGMSVTNLYAMGEAAKTVGGNPAAVQGGIASLQTALAGMSIGMGSAMPQMVGMARLHRYGAHYNKGGWSKGVDEESLFKGGYAYYKQHGRAATMALLVGSGLTSVDQANLIMSPNGFAEYKKAQALTKKITTGGGFESIVRNSLKGQVGIGEKDIAAGIAAEQAFGGIQGGMQTVIGLLTNVYTTLTSILGYVAQWIGGKGTGGLKEELAGADDATIDRIINSGSPTLPKNVAARKALGKKLLMGMGMSAGDAEAMIGNQFGESGMDPVAFNGSHIGLQQWDKSRRAAFAKQFGYQMGSSAVDPYQQFVDQEKFAVQELRTTHRRALDAMAKAVTLAGKVSAFMRYDEIIKDGSFGKRFASAMQMANAGGASHHIHHNISHETHIGSLSVTTPSNDPKAHLAALRQGLESQPLFSPRAQGTVTLFTRALS